MAKRQDFVGTQKGRQAFDFERVILNKFINSTDYQHISKHTGSKIKSHKKLKRIKHKHKTPT